MKVGFISLGCSKNLVDTEITIGIFKNNDFEIVQKIEEAEVIVINTCGFIEPAKQEAIDTIIEVIEHKKNGTCKYLAVMGCLVQRYCEDLKKELPEVDLFITIDEYDKFGEAVKNIINTNNNDKNSGENNKISEFDYENRIVTTGRKTAYLKIAEGCSNRCTYCAIPYIRGEYGSRAMEDILKEARRLADDGYREIILIAQDTTKYGTDIYEKKMLAMLLEKICKIEEFEWIRFLYSYPESITDELIEVVKNNKKICRYFDIPIQHISNRILKTMNRKSSRAEIEELITKIRKEIPDCVLRTSLIVGFPGETEEESEELYDFISDTKFDKIGVFMYSQEEGTPAARLPNQVHFSTKKRRHDRLMKLAMDISEEKLKMHLGNTYRVLIERKTSDNKYYVGRTYMEIPDTDGIVFVKNERHDLEENFIDCKIIDYKGYDLIAEMV